MRRLLCAKCGKDKKDGTRQVLPEGKLGEAAEFERVAWGTAMYPLLHNRTAYVNGAPIRLEDGQYDCDNCGGVIKPGDRCCGCSLWTAYQAEVGAWEHEYLQVKK